MVTLLSFKPFVTTEFIEFLVKISVCVRCFQLFGFNNEFCHKNFGLKWSWIL